MKREVLIVAIFAWQVIGGFIDLIIACSCYADGWVLANPCCVYRYNRYVNWFGATVLALGYTALCPIGALCYWFYKLCVIGR